MKFDDLITQVFDRKKDKNENIKNALDALENKFKQPLSSYKFHPCAYVHLEGRLFVIQQLILRLMLYLAIHKDEGNHQEQVGELIKQTAASIDSLALKMLFVTVQQNNLDICIAYAVTSPLGFPVVHSCCHLFSTLGISMSQAIQWYCFL
jgi:hypothetical protein